jgi:hypothetical protein
MISSTRVFPPFARASAWPSGRAFFFERAKVAMLTEILRGKSA